MRRIYTSGLRPGAVFGAAVNGASDAELKRTRSILSSAHSPSHGGTSLTLKLALHGDPAWKLVVAPALQWSRILWQAVTDPTNALIDTVELVRLWYAAEPLQATTWRSSTGPLQRVELSLRRIGWLVVSPFIWRDDLGRELHLAEHSPNMLGLYLKEAVQRDIERKAAHKLGPLFHGRRACLVLARQLGVRSLRKLDARGRFLVRAASCGALWTADRAWEAGYA